MVFEFPIDVKEDWSLKLLVKKIEINKFVWQQVKIFTNINDIKLRNYWI